MSDPGLLCEITDEDVARWGDRADIVVAVEYWVNSRHGGEASAEDIVMATIAAMHNLGWRPPPNPSGLTPEELLLGLEGRLPPAH